jgi:GDPmannose 4,6-dehydratase
MRAFVIGISGQDGAYLSRFLLSKGYEVIGGSRAAYQNNFSNLNRLGIRERVQIKSVSLSDFRSVLQAVSDTAPDEIYNLSSQSSVGLSFELPVETFESNTIGIVNLLEVIRFLRKPVKLYNACSSECFGSLPGLAATEATPFHPRSPYAVSKAAAYWQVSNYREAYDIFACSGILFNHESPLRPERFVTQKIISAALQIAAGRSAPLNIGNIDIERDWGWAPEYVEAMWMMLQQPKADDYVIGTGESHSLKDFIETTFSSLGVDWQKHVRVIPQLLRPTELQFSRSNPQKAESKLGWKARYRMKDVIRFMLNGELNPDGEYRAE